MDYASGELMEPSEKVSLTHRTRWVRIGEITAWLEVYSRDEEKHTGTKDLLFAEEMIEVINVKNLTV